MAALHGRVLAIGGSDSGGGAGIQADIKTVAAFDAYAETAITAITVQDTRAVYRVEPVSPELIAAQIEAVLADLGADAIKTGMLPGAGAIRAVQAAIRNRAAQSPVIVDPVLAAGTGRAFLDREGIAALKSDLIPLATLLTPNVPEAEALTGRKITNVAAMEDAGRALMAFGARAVLVKGGHLSGTEVTDVLVTAEGREIFGKPRQKTPHTHGT
jgi:hydroxymethylpyrimidine/phosphomethylpyrimidine kinase